MGDLRGAVTAYLSWQVSHDQLSYGLQQIIADLDEELAALEDILFVMGVQPPTRPWVLDTSLAPEYAAFREVYQPFATDTVGWQGRQVYLLLQGLAAARAALLSVPAEFVDRASAVLREQSPRHPQLLGGDGSWLRL
jgi:hypothetical protein